MWYTYCQNNSGGCWKGPAKFVIVEANNPEQADDRAELVGLYFDGVWNGRDCECCGDRWYEAHDYDASSKPTIYGQAIPEGCTEVPEGIDYCGGDSVLIVPKGTL